MNFDFKNMEIYRWFIIGGGGLAVLSVLLYFVKGSRIRVSAFFACFIGCLVLGFGVGVITLGAVGYNWNKKEEISEAGAAPPDGPKNDGPGMPKKGGFGKGDNRKKGGVNVKTQLATLVAKLNLLTESPLSVALNDERKKKIGDLLESLGATETLDDKDAAKALLALQEIIESDRKTMEAVGYVWFSDSADSVAAKDGPNPFAKDDNRSALAALLKRVGKKVPEPKAKAGVEVGPDPRPVATKGAN